MHSKIKTLTLAIAAMLFIMDSGYAQLKFNVVTTERKSPGADSIYIAGNFNNWNPKDTNYMLTTRPTQISTITIDPPVGTLEFKFTRGGWDKVETDEEGNDIPNRVIEYDGTSDIIGIAIPGWKDELSPAPTASGTAADNVILLDNKFYIPQLDRYRRIWLYLPPDYKTTTKNYPVIYMHDGQNLFNERSSFTGEWNVDETLNDLFDGGDPGVIVVGIENGQTFRTEEYTPWENPQYGGGRGDDYIQFIVETLKPHIDSRYRTLSDRKNTAIMGSSLGGLISFCTAIRHQDVFGMAGVLSPSFWYSDRVYDMVDQVGKIENMKIYILGGALESETLIDEINAMASTLKVAGFEDTEIKVVTHADGEHNEQYWSREFKAAYQWLFGR